MARNKLVLPFVWIAVLVLILAACTEETQGEVGDALRDVATTVAVGDGGGDSELPDVELPEVDIDISSGEAEPEPAPEAEGLSTEGSLILILVVVVGLILLLLIARREPAPVTQQVSSVPQPVQSGPAWSERAQMAYTDARWVHDNAEGEAAVWRAEHGSDAMSATDTSRLATVSRDLDQRISRTLEEVYRLEAAAQTPDKRDAARNVGSALKSIETAFDARVGAHRDSLAADSGQDSMRAEPEAEVRLTDARRNLSNALDRLLATM